jgi:hypothetical protein
VTLKFPTPTAYNYVFYLGIAAMIVAIAFSLASRNYTFRKEPGRSDKQA